MRLRFATEEEMAAHEADPEGFSVKPAPGEVIRFSREGEPGSSVNIPAAPGTTDPGTPPPYSEPNPAASGQSGGERNFGNRAGFEQVVFKQLGGNPFEIDVQREIDRASAMDAPALFERVFKGQAIWADRSNLSPKQQEFWREELKRYRAHLKERISSDRQQKVEMYKHMMSTYDTEAKEHEAAAKRVRANEKEFLTSQRNAAKDTEKQMMDLMKAKRDIIKMQGEIISKGTDPATGKLSAEAEAQLLTLADQLKFINSRTHKILMATDAEYRDETIRKSIPTETAAAHGKEGPKAAPAGGREPAPEGEAAAKEKPPETKVPEATRTTHKPPREPKFKPHPLGKPEKVLFNKKQGRWIGKFANGQIAWMEEA